MNIQRIVRPLGAGRIWLALLALLLAGCTVEGGARDIPATRAPSGPQPTDPAVAQAIAQRSQTWVVGLTDLPEDLLPYQPSPSEQRRAAPVSELLFPSPILAYGSGYTTTGVLEQIPTVQNGGIEVRKADVYLDVAGNITTTTTTVITQVDQLVVTFRWNPRLAWSDGTPLTAADSVFAYELAKAAPPSEEARAQLDLTLAYEQVDEHTTRATLKPDRTGPTSFLTYWLPLPLHLLKDVAPDQIRQSAYARQPVGYGPYQIEAREQGGLRMVRNPHYFGPAPAEHLVLTVAPNMDLLRSGVLNGTFDVAFSDRLPFELFPALDQIARDGQAQVRYQVNPIWEHIDYNLDVPDLKDIRIRRALAFGTNRAAMARDLTGAQAPVLESWVLPGQPGAAPADQLTRYPYDPNQANQLLDEAGYTGRDADGIRSNARGLTLTLQLMTTSETPLRAEIARRFQEDMRQIGVNIEIAEVSTGQMFAPDGPLYQRQFELALFGWLAGPEPAGTSLWSCDAVPSERNGWRGENFAGWCFRDANRAILRGSTALDPAQRAQEYLAQQQIWSRELPSLPLFQRVSLVLAGNTVHGLQPDSFAPVTWNVAAWKRG